MAAATPDFSIEERLRLAGVWPVAGVDEVGRGPLAGPVAAAAVILDPDNLPEGVNDSKVLNAAMREAAFASIMARARAVGVAFVSAEEIDATDIRKAALTAMSRAVAALAIKPAHVLVDGRDLPVLSSPGEAIVKGDALSLSIAAASIVAKVVRDNAMKRLAALHPDFGFDTNVGYGVERHLLALSEFGPTPFHRMSFSPLRER